MKTINLNPDTAEWLEWRKGGIGASDAAQVLNLSPYGTAYELWQMKTGRIDDTPKDSYVLTQGHEVESKVRALYEMDQGEDFPPLLAEMEGEEFIRASLDGYNEERGIIEIKMVGQKRFDSGELPNHFKIQATQQMLVTGEEKVTFLLARQPNKAKGIKVDGYKKVVYERDLALMDLVYKSVVAFWACVTQDKPPKKTDKDKPEESKDRIKTLLNEYARADKRAKEAAKKADALKKQIAEKVPESAICHGFEITYSARIGSVDYSAIPELGGVDLDKYRKPPTKSLSIKAAK